MIKNRNLKLRTIMISEKVPSVNEAKFAKILKYLKIYKLVTDK